MVILYIFVLPRFNTWSDFSFFMIYIARIEVGLKPGHSDPEGETTKDSLIELQYLVEAVKVRKIYEVHINAPSSEMAEKQVEEMCRKILSNPVKDNYKIRIEETQ